MILHAINNCPIGNTFSFYEVSRHLYYEKMGTSIVDMMHGRQSALPKNYYEAKALFEDIMIQNGFILKERDNFKEVYLRMGKKPPEIKYNYQKRASVIGGCL